MGMFQKLPDTYRCNVHKPKRRILYLWYSNDFLWRNKKAAVWYAIRISHYNPLLDEIFHEINHPSGCTSTAGNLYISLYISIPSDSRSFWLVARKHSRKSSRVRSNWRGTSEPLHVLTYGKGKGMVLGWSKGQKWYMGCSESREYLQLFTCIFIYIYIYIYI